MNGTTLTRRRSSPEIDRTVVACSRCVRTHVCAFSSLLPAQVDVLERNRVAHRYEPGEPIFHEGTPPLAVYCIHSGGTNLHRLSRSGQQTVVGVRKAGELIGLRAVLTGRNYAATATASESAIICTLPREAFLSLIRECPGLALRLLEKLALESHAMQDRLIAQAVESVASRTARFLLDLSKDNGSTFSPSMSRGQMALFIGTSLESLSRTLRSFADRGIIRLGRREISVLDMPALRDLANE